ncbi:MAG: ferredoxin [Rhodothermales bacterium]
MSDITRKDITRKDIEARGVSGLTVRVERPVCIGSENCVSLAPEVFVLGDDQVVTFVDDVQDIDRERLLEACRICPVDALVVTGPDGEQIVP